MAEREKGQRRHSGSQTRQRQEGIYVACTPEEKAAILEKAEAAGLSAGGYLRESGLNRATPGTKKRQPVDHEILEIAIGELRRVGNNINQLARAANMNQPTDSERLNQAMNDYVAALRGLREAREG